MDKREIKYCPKTRIMVIGCGRWGSFIAWYLDTLNHAVTLYGRATSKHMQDFFETRSNGLLTLSDKVRLTTTIGEAMNNDIIVISVNSQGLQALMDELKEFELEEKTIVLCMKGIEIETGRRLSEIAKEALGPSNKVAVWLGPGHVQEFCAGIQNCMVIDSEDEEAKKYLVEKFQGPLIRFYYGTDLIGNEIGAAAKNVIGIAAGFLDGLNLSTLKGALMSRGTREVARLIKAMGGNELSAYGLCHLGDYEATVFSKFSHNRQFGESFVKKEEYADLAEGYYTVKALMNLKEKVNVDLPICEGVYKCLYENVEPADMLNQLFERNLKHEF